MSATDNYAYLVDRNEIAFLLGVVPTAVSNYVARTSTKHEPFPEPKIVRSSGRFRLWDVAEVEAWHRKTFPKRTDIWEGDVLERLAQFRPTAL